MIVRNVDGIIKIIGNVHDETEFMRLNPTGGFMQVDTLPYCRYSNYKMDENDIDIETNKEAEITNLQYKDDRQYPDIKEQLDMLWHAIDENATLKTQFADFYNTIKLVKDQYPKP